MSNLQAARQSSIHNRGSFWTGRGISPSVCCEWSKSCDCRYPGWEGYKSCHRTWVWERQVCTLQCEQRQWCCCSYEVHCFHIWQAWYLFQQCWLHWWKSYTLSLSLSLDPFLPSLVYTWLHLVDRCLVTTEMPLVQKPSSFKISSSQTSETWLNSETISDLCTWEWDRVNESTNFLCKININGISCSLIWSRAEMSWNRISLTLQAQWQLWIKTTWKILTQQWQ